MRFTEKSLVQALMKSPEKRYQTIKDMLLDLKALKQEMEFAAKLERLSVPGEAAAYQTGRAAAESSNAPGLIAASSASTRQASSAEYLVTEIKQHKRGLVVALSILLLTAIAFTVWSFAHRSASSAQIGSIAVLPFINQSGNPDVE